MRFRPCIDIHNGKVKQIVGGTLADQNNQAKENYVSEQDAGYYARLYRKNGLKGGHIILLNPEGSEYYPADVEQAGQALTQYPGGLQIGGGMNPQNAGRFLEMGATHVIVTSYVFRDGVIYYDRLKEMVKTVGKEHLVLDLSCRKREDQYYVVTDRWQKFTKERVCVPLMEKLADYCDEFLIHAVDMEGTAKGIEEPLAKMLGAWSGRPITYAGGVGSFEDLERLKSLGKNHLDVTIGSALDLFGGSMKYKEVLRYCKESEEGRR